MRKTRVIHVITRFDKGGSAENTFLTAAGLDREAYEVRAGHGLLARVRRWDPGSRPPSRRTSPGSGPGGQNR